MRILSVCLSVCLSVKRVDCDKTEERFAQIFIPYERPFSLVLLEENGWWRRPLLPEIVGQPPPPPRWSGIANFQPIFARSASAVIPAKKFN